MGHAIYLLVPLFMPNTTFADANSLARLGAYQSNRLLPPVQAIDMVDTLHFNSLQLPSTPEAVARRNGDAYNKYSYRKYGKVDNWIDSDWQAVVPESKINKGDYILWMTPTNR